jgi:hypothetical protein
MTECPPYPRTGDNLDVNLPDAFPSDATPASGAIVDAITHTSTHGFLGVHRAASGGWTFKAARC